MGLYATLTFLLGLTLWKPKASLYLFVLASPLVSVYQGLGWDPRVGWACFLGIRAMIPVGTNKPPVSLRVILAATTFFVLSGFILRLNLARISPEDLNSAWTFFVYFVAGSLFIVAAWRFLDREEALVKALLFLGIAAFEVAAYAFWQGYGFYTGNQFDRVGSTLINPNSLASYMNVCAIALLSARRLRATRKWRVFVWSVFGIASIVLFLSLSRSGVIAFMCGLIFLWATASGKLSLKKTVVLVVASSIVALASYTLVRTFRIQKAAAEVNDKQAAHTEFAQSMEDFSRYEAATFALQQWSEHPVFGIGFEAFAAVNYEKNGFYVTTHNTVLQLLVGTGLIGVGLVIYIFKQLWGELPKQARLLLIPIAATVGINSMFGDFLGSIELMTAVSIAFFLCKRFSDPSTSRALTADIATSSE